MSQINARTDSRRTKTKDSFLRRLSRLNLPYIPVTIILLLILASIFGPFLTGQDPYAQDLTNRLMPPSGSHLLGTDVLGRDNLTRLLVGSQTTLQVVVLSILVGGLVGLILGMVSGYFGGMPDAIISRITDALLGFPTIFFGLLFAVTLGPGYASVVIAISVSIWSWFVRIIRSEVLTLRERAFIAQARVNGGSSFYILRTHILPNVLNSFVVLVSVNLGSVIVVEATLSFLGAGIPPPTPSWGRLVAEGQQYLTSAWWLAIVPGIAITITVISVFLFGDWVRDYLDPTVRQALGRKSAASTRTLA